jgi:hypothetical protein
MSAVVNETGGCPGVLSIVAVDTERQKLRCTLKFENSKYTARSGCCPPPPITHAAALHDIAAAAAVAFLLLPPRPPLRTCTGR